jgi:hypothetical protein
MALPPVPKGVELRESPVHGIGAFATEDLPAGSVIGEYTGIKMLKTDFIKQYGSDIQHVYWTKQNFPNSVVMIAKGEHRNFITFVNESAEPNVALRKRMLYALKNISSGSELFLRYDSAYPRDYQLGPDSPAGSTKLNGV